jgi:O-antigen ligase
MSWRSWSGRLYHWLLLLTLAWGVFSFGGVYPWGYWTLATASAALGVWAIFASRVTRPTRLTAIVCLLVAGAGLMALQMVPVPYATFAALSPAGDRFLRAWDLAFTVRTPPSHPLSLTPDRTLLTLALYGSLGLLLVGLVRGTKYLRLRWLVTRLIVVGLVISVAGVIQKAAYGADEQLLFGFWKPYGRGDAFGPFVNRNHFAGWMLMMLPLAAGYSWAVLQSVPHPDVGEWRQWLGWSAGPYASRVALALVSVIGLGAALVLTGSRSGIASLAVCVVAFGAFLYRAAGSRAGRRLVVGYAAVLLAGAVAWGGIGMTARRFALASTDLPGRISVWTDTVRIIRDFPVTGVGFGAFGRAMLVYQTQPRDHIRNGVFEQSHNDYLQVAAEAGAPGALLTVLFLAVVAVRIRQRLGSDEPDDLFRRWIRVGAVCGLLAIATQSLVEFSLQLMGNTVLFVLLLAIALHPAPTPVPDAHRV